MYSYYTYDSPIGKLTVAGSETHIVGLWLVGQKYYMDVLTGKETRQRGVPTMSARAVGGAVGHNPISIIVPCHRVVGINGELTGYAGGTEIKAKLLEFEGVKIK